MRLSVTRALSGALKRSGYELIRRRDTKRGFLSRTQITDVRDLLEAAAPIPCMLSEETARILYALCFAQEAKGDVVEIGSWQGYSTSFLARAVKDSGNGKLYAIDHFKGNVGKESRYVVGKKDLSDLQSLFEVNMQRLGVKDSVELLAMPNEEAAQVVSSKKVRFLFIDGDHTREGVERDIALFFPLLVPGAIVVFDDFTGAFPGVVDAVDELVARSKFQRVFSFENTVVIKL
jgi:predicted O-methyltransferase YrrM